MWTWVIDKTLRRFLRSGALEVTFADGHTRRYGEPEAPPLRIEIRDPALPRRLVMSPELALGEAYMEGDLVIADDNLHGFLGLLVHNRETSAKPPILRLNLALRQLRRRLDQFNPAGKARQRVAHHYDLDDGLYDLFLDRDRQYSCGYFAHPNDSLETAQEQKKALIARKLLLARGQHVLDIGCGWGGLALTLAREHGVRVTGVTLSEEQIAVARARAEAEGLADRVEFRLMDYREVEGQFDRVVSVGMFEHVGLPHYREFMETVGARLAPDGVALIHTIGRCGPPASNSPWIERYIFPGGYIPSLSEVAPAIDRSGLWCCDLEVWRMHYARTLRHWYDRFCARADEARALYDDRFVRMWKYYLAACDMTFRRGQQAVFQFQLSHAKDAVPLTRDYLSAPTPTGRSIAAE